MQYKAVIFDLDGTAIPNQPGGMPSERLIKAVGSAQGKMKLCAATGRPLTNAQAILTALNLKDPCVISAGTQIADPRTGEILWEATIMPDDVGAILGICKPYEYEVLVRDELMGEGGSAATRSAIEGHVNAMYVMGCAPSDAEVILTEINQIPSVTAAGVVSWTHKGIDIHITHREATKEHAVAELLRLLNLSSDEVVGVGDADNDVHLFAGVGYKVAMGNGTDRLKRLADRVVDTVDNDGLAKIIEEFS